jgi:hypothetical protein
MFRIPTLPVCWLLLGGICLSADAPDPAKSPVLDTFPSGQWKGMNAVFQAKNFDATLDKDRILRIQPKLDGKNTGMPVLVRFNAYFSRDGSSFGRDLLSLEKRPAPAMQPKKVEFAGHYEQKIKFTFSIEFSERGVTVEGDVKDPPVIKYPTTLAYAAYFGATHQIPKETPPEEIKQLTEGHTVKFTDAKRQSDTRQFWEVIQSRPNAVATGEVSGPWGSRRVIVDMPATARNGKRIGNYGNYTVTAFYRGGWWFSRGATDKVEGGPLTVRVE